MAQSPNRETIRKEVLAFLKNHGQRAFRPNELAQKLDYDSDNDLYRAFREELDEMDAEGVVRRGKGLRYRHLRRKDRSQQAPPVDAEHPNQVIGRLIVNPRGFGFIDVEGREEDLFVREPNMGLALDGDIVRAGLAAPAKGDDRQEAEVLEVVERRRTQAVGTFKQKGHFAFVEPDDQKLTQDVYVPKESFGGAQDGDKVLVSIDAFEDRKASPEGRVLQVIGSGDDPSTQVLALAMSFDVRAGFPDDVMAEADAIPTEIPQSEIDRRLDLRDKPIFTIDPDTAKDFDDAIHVIRLDNNDYEVGVHIADVTHYLKPGTAMEREARERATSTYLVDRTLPMLPEKLSNEVCSLRPKEDKLAFSCVMRVTPQGDVVDYAIGETIIHSKHRYTYDDAQDRLDGGYPDDPLSSDIVQAGRLARTLTKRRMREGSVDFDLPEVKVILDDEGNPVDIIRKERKDANRLVEEFMLLANRTVARHVVEKENDKLFVYRIHDKPDAEKIAKLADYVRAFGYDLKMEDGNVTSQELNRMLTKVKGKPEAPPIELAAVQSMAKAVYSTDNIGHYGLGFEFYSHFTSPIRRMPDVLAHRLLKLYAQGKNAGKLAGEMKALLEHCSEREKAATQAERESVKLKQVQYVQQHLGETFDGVVAGVTKFGLFVELQPLLVEGLVHVRDLDDYFEYDESSYKLVGQRKGKVYKLGDKVRVKVAKASVEKREVDLVLA